MDDILANLHFAINNQDNDGIIYCLRKLVEHAETEELSDVTILKTLLNTESVDILINATKTIAQLCKANANRTLFTDEFTINKLMLLLDFGSDAVVYNTVRALGNICFDNAEACELVDKSGLEGILTLLREDHLREPRTDQDSDTLTCKVAALLANIFIGNDNIPKVALRDGILPIIERLLVKCLNNVEANKNLVQCVLNMLNALTEYMDGHEYLVSPSLVMILIELLKTSDYPEIGVTCIEIFHPLADKDDVKVVLAQYGVCETLFEHIQKYRDKIQDVDTREVLQFACDLIVLILTGDSSMDLLYCDGTGLTYLNMLSWLDSEDPDLLYSGVLALGNFARKDTNCIQMVQRGVGKKIIDLISRYNRPNSADDLKVIHALLSTMKNLVIPKENKVQAVKNNLVENLYPLLKVDKYMIVFKLLGCFRMLIDGQEDVAVYLLSKKDFIERLVYWWNNSDHLGVRGEVPRIFSWLIKNCQSSVPFPQFVSIPDSVKCIVDMILSYHGIMQNEAFFALYLLEFGLRNEERHLQVDVDEYHQRLCEASLGKNLNFALTKFGDKWDTNTIHNCLSLIDQLANSERIHNELSNENIIEVLKGLKENSVWMQSHGQVEKTLHSLLRF